MRPNIARSRDADYVSCDAPDLDSSSERVNARSRIAILIPCLNEETTIATVIGDFERELPARSDLGHRQRLDGRPPRERRGAGARVVLEPRMGKGFAIRAAFRDIEADVYVLADGDGQLPAETVHDLIRPVLEGQADMVVGSRALAGQDAATARSTTSATSLFSRVLRALLDVRVTDVLSGYRALSRLLVKGLPLASRNFEIEVELTIKTTERSYRIAEVPFEVRPRAAGVDTPTSASSAMASESLGRSSCCSATTGRWRSSASLAALFFVVAAVNVCVVRWARHSLVRTGRRCRPAICRRRASMAGCWLARECPGATLSGARGQGRHGDYEQSAHKARGPFRRTMTWCSAKNPCEWR